MRRIVTVVIVVILAAVVGVLALSVHSDSLGAQVAAGKRPRAPAFDLRRLSGAGAVRLAALRGRVVVVNFWASWCAPCKDEAPVFEQIAAEHRGDGVTFIGVDSRDVVEDARAFAKRYGLSYELVRDGDGHVKDRWGVTGFPETFVVDATGRVVAHIGQGIAGADLEGAIAKARA